MKIYNYKHGTQEFTHQTVARENPLEPDQYLLPADATFIAPMTTEANEVAVFDNDQWTSMADHRGTTYWTPAGEEKVIEDLGVVVPANGSATEVLPLEILRSNVVMSIQTEALRRITIVTNVINTFEEVQLIALLWPALDTAALGASMIQARDIYVHAKKRIKTTKTAKRTTLNTYDPVADPNWP